MGVDPRQILAGVLTLTMFLMLGSMIKRDFYASIRIRGNNKAGYDGLDWREDGLAPKPCWKKPVLNEGDEWRGYITFSLTHGPEFHVSQIADAVVVARYLRAMLVIPDIRGRTPGAKRDFEDVYNIEKVIESLAGAVKVVKSMPQSISAHNLTVVKIPHRVTEEHIAKNIEPVFRARGNIRIVTYFPSVNMKKNTARKSSMDSIACLAMFGTLEPRIEVREVVESMVDQLTSVSRKSNGGPFVAVDLRLDMLEKKGCKEHLAAGLKSCYGPTEVALFLKNIGFDNETTVYVTQTKWHNSLYAIKEFFPKTYTKESLLPMDKKEEFLNPDSREYEKLMDYYICSKSDVFVPAISGLFYANVAGKRIASGRTQTLVPASIYSPARPEEFVSPYVSEKNHIAYSCFC